MERLQLALEPKIASQFCKAVLTTARAQSAFRSENTSQARNLASGNLQKFERAKSVCGRERRILVSIVRSSADDLASKGVDLLSAVVALRRMAMDVLAASDVPESAHEPVLAEISTGCLYEYYSAAGTSLL